MSGNTQTVASLKLKAQRVRILRYAFGATLSMAVALGFNWPLAFLTPVLTLGLLSGPGPGISIKHGFIFILTVAAACYIILTISQILLPYPYIFILLIFLLLLRIYYAMGGGTSPVLLTFMLISLSVIPLLMIKEEFLGEVVAFNIVVGATAMIVIVWLSYGIMPFKQVNENQADAHAHPPPEPRTKHERFITALESALIFFPVIISFFIFQWTGAILTLVFISLLSGQPGFAKDFKAGKALIIGNVAGGIIAIVFYQFLVTVPNYYFMTALTLLCALIFGTRFLSDKPNAALYGKAFATLLMVIVQATSGTGEAESKVVMRIIQLSAAVVYVVVAFGLLNHFKSVRKNKEIIR
jgi:uncharacterized membrane protein YccC